MNSTLLVRTALRSVNRTNSIIKPSPLSFKAHFSTTRSNMSVKVINSYEEFQEIINGDKVAAIDFWATWCGPCKMISPLFEKFAAEAPADQIAFYKVDVDEQDKISQEVGIKAMPTFAFFKNGQKVAETVGAVPQQLQATIKQVLA